MGRLAGRFSIPQYSLANDISVVENRPNFRRSFWRISYLEGNLAGSSVQSLDVYLQYHLRNVRLKLSSIAICNAYNYTGVSRELGEGPNVVGTLNSLVGYSIRLESNTTKNTRLAFVTNGIALRMLEGGSGQGGQGTAFDEITVRRVYIQRLQLRSQ